MNNVQSFGHQSDRYARHRPAYPPELFAWLSSLAVTHNHAWDCATGSGQAAAGLAAYFARVEATDLIETQVQHAIQHPNIHYQVCSAEETPFRNNLFDLVTVALAVHWFNLDKFYAEARRVLKPGGVLAVWGYGFFEIQPDIDRVIAENLLRPIDRFWAPGNRLVMAGYRTLPFPLAPILNIPEFEMRLEWNRGQLLDYLSTWSAVKRCQAETGENPIDLLQSSLETVWQDPGEIRQVTMPIYIRVGKV